VRPRRELVWRRGDDRKRDQPLAEDGFVKRGDLTALYVFAKTEIRFVGLCHSKIGTSGGRMLTKEQCNQFHQDGFLLVRDVLSRAQVAELRNFCQRVFDAGLKNPGDDLICRSDVFCHYPEIRWLLTHAPVLGALKSLVGNNFVYMHEWACHDSFFGEWHKDTTSQERAGERFHYEPDYLQVEAALYLQDNGSYGGGLDVIPGSHRDTADPYLVDNAWTRTRTRLRSRHLWPSEKGYKIPSRAGDLVLFHFRARHKASSPVSFPVPPQHRKFSLFLAASRNNEYARRFINWTRSNGDRPHLIDHCFPPDLVQLVKEQGVGLV
jgi:hypothetical protein